MVWGYLSEDVKSLLSDLKSFYFTIFYFLVKEGEFDKCPYFQDRREIRVWIYSLTIPYVYWDIKHYRNSSFQEDCFKNLRNVAIPYTGIPLSLLFLSPILYIGFILFVFPLICVLSTFIELVNEKSISLSGMCVGIQRQILQPRDWFSIWRMNCMLSSLHAYKTKSNQYELENKWSFLKQAKAKNIPVTPFFEFPNLVVKDKNEEGGLGFHLFKNASNGGDWIFQSLLQNSKEIAVYLPNNCALSTFRLITSSTNWLDSRTEGDENFKVLVSVFRAALAGSNTDHESIMFDVDITSGLFKEGFTNNHWYNIGLSPVSNVLKSIFQGEKLAVNQKQKITHHPDSEERITGNAVPHHEDMIALVKQAHKELCPDIPLIGWDVALTEKGILLLEANLSCNFFCGSFDRKYYFNMLDNFFSELTKNGK